MTSNGPASPRIAVREVTAADGDLLVDMVLEAVNWDGGTVTRRGVLGTPRLARYAIGWGRPGDLGLVAVDIDGPRGLHVPIGMAWLRLFTTREPGYGFIAEDVPELSLAIVPGRRRLGIGRALLAALVAKARDGGIERISLSVARANPGIQLYRQAGFTAVEDAQGTTDDTVTMVLELQPGGSGASTSS